MSDRVEGGQPDHALDAVLGRRDRVVGHVTEVRRARSTSLGIGDSSVPGAVFRLLRTTPVLVEVARDVAELAPDALLLNCSNPMTAAVQAIHGEVGIELLDAQAEHLPPVSMSSIFPARTVLVLAGPGRSRLLDCVSLVSTAGVIAGSAMRH